MCAALNASHSASPPTGWKQSGPGQPWPPAPVSPVITNRDVYRLLLDRADRADRVIVGVALALNQAVEQTVEAHLNRPYHGSPAASGSGVAPERRSSTAALCSVTAQSGDPGLEIIFVDAIRSSHATAMAVPSSDGVLVAQTRST